MNGSGRDFHGISYARRAFIFLCIGLGLVAQVFTDQTLSMYLDTIGFSIPFRKLSNIETILEPDDDAFLEMPFELDQNASRSLKWFSLGRTKNEVNMSEFAVREAKKFKKSYRILALGGTTTWGRSHEEKKNAFPAVVSKMLGRRWKASDLVVRADDAAYSSQCIESMIRDSVETIDEMVDPFDIILLEFSLGSMDGIELLLKRLRRRYPNAVIVYVHLWSLGRVTETKPTDSLCKGTFCMQASEHVKKRQQIDRAIRLRRLKDTAAFTPTENITRHFDGKEWAFSDKMLEISKQQNDHVKRALSKVEGLMFELPVPETPHRALSSSWFDSDLHHLSGGGHKFLAQQIYYMLKKSNVTEILDVSVGNQTDGTWGKGDQCMSWIENGKANSVHFKGGKMKEFGEPVKYALHIGGNESNDSASIYFENYSDEYQPLRLEVMSYNDGFYPKAQVHINMQRNQTKNDTNVHYHIDPMHPDVFQQQFHIPRSAYVDQVKPGRNKITIEASNSSQQPLRVTGLIMCGACHEMGFGSSDIRTKRVEKNSSVPVIQ